MGFQLADDNDPSSPSKRNSPTGSSTADDFSLDTDTGKSKQDDWNEGFGPQVNDTVFIANQYQGSRPAATSVSSKSSGRVTNSFPPFLMLISAALNILCMVLIVMQIKGTVTDAQSLMTVASSYTLLVVAAEVCLIADDNVMCVKGNGFWLIILALCPLQTQWRFFSARNHYHPVNADHRRSIFLLCFIRNIRLQYKRTTGRQHRSCLSGTS